MKCYNLFKTVHTIFLVILKLNIVGYKEEKNLSTTYTE